MLRHLALAALVGVSAGPLDNAQSDDRAMGRVVLKMADDLTGTVGALPLSMSNSDSAAAIVAATKIFVNRMDNASPGIRGALVVLLLKDEQKDREKH